MRISLLAMLALLAVAAADTPAVALSNGGLGRNGHLSLPLRPSEREARSYGTVGAVLARLRRRDPSCGLDTYAYGGTFACGERPGEPGSARILIDFRSIPTRWPDSAYVHALRVNGVDGGEVPAADRARVLSELLGRPR